MSKVQPVAVMSCVIDDVLPLFRRAEFKCRQGAIECLALIVEKMETEAVTWWLSLLILPVLGRMSDQNDQVRLLATNTFATLVKLVPLGSCIPDPVDLPKELLAHMPLTTFAVHGPCIKHTDVHAYSSEQTPPVDKVANRRQK